MNSAKDLGYVLCKDCNRVNRVGSFQCLSCNGKLHLRTPNSLQAAWAWLATAAVLIFPANLYPITLFTVFGNEKPDTILSGTLTLVKMGMFPIAVIVFTASIAVPIIKIVGLTYIYFSVQRHVKLSDKARTRMFHFIEWIGRWSMMDLFVISIMSVLMDLGHISSFEAGPATAAFGLVVFCTMVSSKVFDTRLLWDAEQASEEHLYHSGQRNKSKL
ncbi:paraquat-inducible protein A [Algicola sagamiensis]|uniref:paraquat-inducible protein A n=1 Tax=Algicola sagamiensis TaxID=163869 RepID=UPI000371C7E7|nr:paraquat-inducible protein A [Algicola sagamiensis]